jgi:hypothetical protein
MAIWRSGPAKLATIGFLGSNTPSTQSPWTTAFVQRLREARPEHLACFRSEDFAHVGAEAPPLRIAAGMQKRCRRALKRSSLTRLFSTSGESISSAD